jgi:hypothetical protein
MAPNNFNNNSNKNKNNKKKMTTMFNDISLRDENRRQPVVRRRAARKLRAPSRRTRRSKPQHNPAVDRTLYVVRLASNGQLANARPCQQCAMLMRACGVRRVVYSAGDGRVAMERCDAMLSAHLSAAQRRVETLVSTRHRRWQL